jgi:hypothetical protein
MIFGHSLTLLLWPLRFSVLSFALCEGSLLACELWKYRSKITKEHLEQRESSKTEGKAFGEFLESWAQRTEAK